MKSTICFFNTAKVWGGGEKWYYDISTFLKPRGYRVIVITSSDSELQHRLNNTDIKTYALKIRKHSYLNLWKIRLVREIFIAEGVKTLVMNLSSDVKIAAYAAKNAGVERIIYRRGSAIPIKNTFYNRFIFKHWITEILANSQETKRTINARNPHLFPEEKITVIYNGIDLRPFVPCSVILLRNTFIIGNLARLEYEKGHSYLLRIAGILRDKGLDFELQIAGEGSLRNKIEKEIDRLRLRTHVKLMGFCQDPPRFLRNIDVFVFTSLWEGFGYAMTEAMACYKPVVAFNLSSIPEIVTDGHNGYLIEPFDEEAFAKKIITLARNGDVRKQLGVNARQTIEKRFAKEKIYDDLENFLTGGKKDNN